MAKTSLAKAYVQIIPTTDGITASLGNAINPAAQSAGQSAGGKLGGAIKAAILEAGIGVAIKQTVQQALAEGAELQQNLGGTEAVFGAFAESIQKSAQEAYKNMGMSASDYMATANKMGSLFQGSGIEQQKSLDLTAKAMQRAADVASVMGLDVSSAMESIAGAAKGNFTMMDNLGVAMNATTLQAYALEKGINFNWNTASNAEKSELAMQMFFERTEQYAGNFANEAEKTLSGSIDAVKSAWSNLLGNLTLGRDIGPSLTALKDTVVTFVSGNLLPAVANIFATLPSTLLIMVGELLPSVVSFAAEAVGALLTGLGEGTPQILSALVSGAAEAVGALIGSVPALISAGMTLVLGLAEGVLQGIPELLLTLPELIGSLLDSIIDSIPTIVETGVTLLTSLVTDLPVIIKTITETLPKIINGISEKLTTLVPLVVNAGVQLFVALVQNLPAIIQGVVQAIPELISAVLDALGNYWGSFASIGADLMRGLADGIANAVGGVIQKAKEAATRVLDTVKDFFGIHSPSTEMAWVGEMLDAGLASGISDNARQVSNAIDEVTRMTTDTFTNDLAVGVSYDMAQIDAAYSVSAGGENEVELLRQAVDILGVYLPAVANMKVVLDSGKTVGELAPAMDTELGRIARERERG